MYRWVLNLLETCETRLIATLRLNHMLEIASSHRMIDGLVLLLNWTMVNHFRILLWNASHTTRLLVLIYSNFDLY